MRQIALDTETTGLEPSEGHRIIEIGCIEMLNRKITGNAFHVYCNPGCAVETGALQVHGIDNAFLQDKPEFNAIVQDLLSFIKDAELIIHNAPFDVGFLNHEFKLAGLNTQLSEHSKITDSLPMARKLHPGQRNSLDALCKRYNVDNSERDLHGALLDAQLLARVYLAMTGGQGTLFSSGGGTSDATSHSEVVIQHVNKQGTLKVIKADPLEQQAHKDYLQYLEQTSQGQCVWLAQDKEDTA